MAVLNYSGGELNAKVVYYGPGLSGKTTNLEHMYSKLPRENKGKMVSMKTRTDRTLFFDFLPIDIGEINGMKVRFLLYTVPGQVYYNATRKLVLKGVDAVVFVADSSPERMQENKESLQNLEENLNDLGLSLKEMPWVIQYNKRDMPNRLEFDVMNRELNKSGVPAFEAVANRGTGVYETFEGIAKLTFRMMQEQFKDGERPREARIERGAEGIAVEVVAKGSRRVIDSETDVSEHTQRAEKREEEPKSVSEFIDTVLENGGAESPNLGATRDGYEEYGHVVELGDVETAARSEEPRSSDQIEIISDPLAKLAETEPAAAGCGGGDGGREQPIRKAAGVEAATEKPSPRAPAAQTDAGEQPSAGRSHAGQRPAGQTPAEQPSGGQRSVRQPSAEQDAPAAAAPKARSAGKAPAAKAAAASRTTVRSAVAEDDRAAAHAPVLRKTIRIPVRLSKDEVAGGAAVTIMIEVLVE